MRKGKNNFDYFECFSEFSKCACDAAKIVCDTAANFDINEFAKNKQKIHEIENKADAIKHDAIERLAREFITPIEREDIVALLQELDNVVDSIDDIMGHLYMFNVSAIKPETAGFAELVLKSCEALGNVFAEFANFRRSKTIKDNITLVNTLETEGDALHSEAVHKLFERGDSTLDIIIWKDIFDCFEDCLDGCEHVADVVEGVMMKNS